MTTGRPGATTKGMDVRAEPPAAVQVTRVSEGESLSTCTFTCHFHCLNLPPVQTPQFLVFYRSGGRLRH